MSKCPMPKWIHDLAATPVAYLIDVSAAKLVWFDPEKVKIDTDNPTMHSAARCPAIQALARSNWLIRAPFDINVAMVRQGNQFTLVPTLADAQSTINFHMLTQLLTISPPDSWRSLDRPIIQLATPYRFFSDTPGSQLISTPPYQHYTPLPGQLFSGSMDLYGWAGRQLNWAFEWYDLTQPVSIKRGDPWLYVSFVTPKPVRLYETEMTEPLRQQITRIYGVTDLIKGTAGLFAKANAKRPKKLL